MNYFIWILLPILMLLIFVGVKYLRKYKAYKSLLVKYNEAIVKIKDYEVQLTKQNEKLKEALELAESNKEMYLKTFKLYELACESGKELKEDLDFAKAILTGDLSEFY